MSSNRPSPTNKRFVYVAAGFAALGGLLFGYDTGVISGAVIFIRKDFALTTFPQELVVSMVLLGATVGAITGGRFADRLGRRLTLIGTSIVFIAGALICASAPSFAILVAGRVVVGLGMDWLRPRCPSISPKCRLRRRAVGRCPCSSWRLPSAS